MNTKNILEKTLNDIENGVSSDNKDVKNILTCLEGIVLKYGLSDASDILIKNIKQH